jgi:hypothetical protein
VSRLLRDPARSQLNRVTRPVFLSAANPMLAGAGTGLVAARPGLNSGPCDQRPNSLIGPGFGSILAPGKGSESEASSPVTSAFVRQSEWSFWNPVREFGGTENHPAPNDPKLGRLRCARQGLVRVPESNTKYGGKQGNQGGRARLDWGQVSVSPQGFPREKICLGAVNSSFRPLFTGQLFIAAYGRPGIALRRLT